MYMKEKYRPKRIIWGPGRKRRQYINSLTFSLKNRPWALSFGKTSNTSFVVDQSAAPIPKLVLGSIARFFGKHGCFTSQEGPFGIGRLPVCFSLHAVSVTHSTPRSSTHSSNRQDQVLDNRSDIMSNGEPKLTAHRRRIIMLFRYHHHHHQPLNSQ